jgi:hypothetical protein
VRCSITLVLLLALLPSCAWPSSPDDLTARLNKSVSNYNLGTFNFVSALIRVSNDFEIPIGIVWVNSVAAHAELSFAWKKTTAMEIIQDIASTQLGYQVEVRNGVVHIWPSGLIPDRENFLKLKVPAFDVHDAYIEIASFKLHMLVAPRKYGQISIGGTGDSKVTLELKNASVEAALDALVVASNRKIWVVTFSDDAKLTATGLRRAESLWSGKATPDEEQPSWDLIRWGDPLPPLLAGNQASVSDASRVLGFLPTKRRKQRGATSSADGAPLTC